MPRKWIQPRLDGGSLRYINVTCGFHWPNGWRASISIAQEDAEPSEPVQVATLSEATSDELRIWLSDVFAWLVLLD